MMLFATSAFGTLYTLAADVAATLLPASPHPGHIVPLLLSFGLIGLFLVSVVDSSFVPLPVPGITDIMIVVLAAKHANLIFLVAAASLGSAVGGYLSYEVGHAGGLAFLKKHVPSRIFDRVCSWMEHHAILSVALPAVLPPPMPLAPFVLAAGALDMSKKKFLTTFSVSRLLRHTAAAAIGVYFGSGVLHLWNMFTHKYGLTILIAIWSVILLFVGIAFWKIYKASHSFTASTKHSRSTA